MRQIDFLNDFKREIVSKCKIISCGMKQGLKGTLAQFNHDVEENNLNKCWFDLCFNGG